MSSITFDETDLESFYFKGINYDDARNILLEEEEGVFLIRDSSRGGYVICVKEDGDVSQYTVYATEIGDQTNFYIREECPFKNISLLLSFYKKNMFKSTALTRPVSDERVILRRNVRDGCDRSCIRSEIPSGSSHSPSPSPSLNAMRRSAPPDMTKPFDSSSQPLYARVIKPREPRAYTKDLPLRVNDLIRVTSRSTISGIGTGELNGKVGDFPLINVEFIDHIKPN